MANIKITNLNFNEQDIDLNIEEMQIIKGGSLLHDVFNFVVTNIEKIDSFSQGLFDALYGNPRCK